MLKKVYNLFVILGILVLIAILAFMLIFLIMFSVPPSRGRLQRELIRNEVLFAGIAEFFIISGLEELIITNTDGAISIFPREIELSEDVVHKFEYLFNNLNYRRVSKRNNYIIFDRWGGMYNSVGLLYLFEGNEPINNDSSSFFARIEELRLPNWFFYESRPLTARPNRFS